jgi:hypothetical protein
MTVTYKKGMLATIGTPGMRIAQYRLTGGGTEAGLTITAKDIGLSTIYSMSINEEQLNAAPARRFVVGIGTFTAGKGDANYATVRAVDAGGTTVTSVGTNVQVMAIGI